MERLCKVRWHAALAAAALAACGGASSSSDAGQGGPTGLAVTGSLRNLCFRDDGTAERSVPPSLAQYSVAALVEEGGVVRESFGSFSADGSFTIPDSGSGDYLLRFLAPAQYARYIAETSRAIDLARDLVGCADRHYASQSTLVTFEASGLAPWAGDNTLTLFAPSAWLLDRVSLSASASSGSLPYDFRYHLLPAPGDAAWLFETVQRTSGAVSYSVIARSADLTGHLAPAEGTSTTVPAALTTPPQGSVGLALVRSAFLSGLADVAPAATVTAGSFQLSIEAVPGPFGIFYSTSPHPVLFRATLPSGGGDFDFGPIGYPRPFPAFFSELRVTSLELSVRVPAALGALETTIDGLDAARFEPVADAPAAIVPRLGPARLPLVAGRDGLVPQQGVGLTPSLSWSAPLLGTPSFYWVQIVELAQGMPIFRGSITVRGTSAIVPPLLLQHGAVYVAVIHSVAEPGFDFASPNRNTVPLERVPFVTAPFTP